MRATLELGGRCPSVVDAPVFVTLFIRLITWRETLVERTQKINIFEAVSVTSILALTNRIDNDGTNGEDADV